MEKAKKRVVLSAGIGDIGDDLLQQILSRLPALSFASAACVSRSWNFLCNRLLSTPKLSSAVSFNPSLENAVDEVMEKVLSEPIRPQFAMASIGPSFSLEAALELIYGKLGYKVPVIVNVAEGVIGQDVSTNQFVEVQWEVTEEEDHDAVLPEGIANHGIILTVGSLPGLEPRIVPLFQRVVGPQSFLIDEFVMNIRKSTSAISDSESPVGMILYAGQETDIKHVIQKMEFAFPKETFIVGDGGSQFLYKSGSSNGITGLRDSTCGAVALLFARNRKQPLGIGEIQFHVMLSTGLSPIGQKYKAASVKYTKTSTWLTASRETMREHLDGQALLDDIYDELGDRIQFPVFYVGVTKRRKCSVGVEKVQRMHFLEFHDVLGGDEEYLFLNSVGIKSGDPFRFYISDSKAALSSCASDDLRHLQEDCDRRKVFGGIVFSCCGRGDSFFGHPGIDSSPFLSNFPGVTFGGTYCAGEIARGCSSLYEPEEEEVVHSNQHVYSAVYLVMSYRLPTPEQ